MYIYLGEDTVVRLDDIIGIFDLENLPAASPTQKLLAKAEKAAEVVNVSMELPRSFILCSTDNKITVYISQISAGTLRKRARIFSGSVRGGSEESDVG